MAARERPFTEAVYKERLKAGRGQGTGANYSPWVHRDDFLSLGTRYLASCGRTGREAHLLSVTEHKGFLFYDYRAEVTQLREGFPLELQETREIATSLGIQHPLDMDTRHDTVMTTDLVVDAVDSRGQVVLLPRSCKLASGLNIFNAIEHAEIERRYWQRRGWQLKFITESQSCISDIMYANLELMRTARFLHLEEQPYEGYLDEACELVERAVLDTRTDITLGQLVTSLKPHMHGTTSAAKVALYLIYRHRLLPNLSSGSFLSQKVADISAATTAASKATERRRA